MSESASLAPGGMANFGSVWETARRSRLLFGCPAATAAPRLPPWRTAALESNRSPESATAPAWQLQQFF